METTSSYQEVTQVVTEGYEDMEEKAADTSGSTFRAADWVIFTLMLVVSVVIGVISAVRSRRNANTNDFLLGGRNMQPIAVGISLVGGMISAISILGKTVICFSTYVPLAGFQPKRNFQNRSAHIFMSLCKGKAYMCVVSVFNNFKNITLFMVW